ncbi:MAG: hypothetical protein KAI80_09120 [Hyphomicrobiaceae bacterium]|nr:hypothetical protein [Hyphomicrobiaceae bacterium]
MPQTDYNFIEAILGQLAVYDPASIDSLVNTLPSQQSTVVTGGVDTAGDYVITVVGEEGTFTASFTRVAENTAAITDGLAAAWLADAANANIATMTSDGVDTNTLDFLHAGNGYTVTVSAPAPGTLTAALVVDPNGVNIPLAIAVTSDDGEAARLPTAGDTAQDIWGIVVRNADLVQELSQPQPTVLEFLPAAELSVMRTGEAWVAPEVAVAVNDPVFVRVTATGSEQAGALSNVTDGGDNVQVAGRWKTAAAAGELARVLLNMP